LLLPPFFKAVKQPKSIRIQLQTVEKNIRQVVWIFDKLVLGSSGSI
jgi:hypothetical protein